MHGHLNVKDMRFRKGIETEEHSIKFIEIKFSCFVAVSQKICYVHITKPKQSVLLGKSNS